LIKAGEIESTLDLAGSAADIKVVIVDQLAVENGAFRSPDGS
jgi:hypothetical protein